MRRKIIIDTDPGHDDAMALMLAAASPALEILAVTTVCGNSTIQNVTRNARHILRAIGREDIPVYSGASKPLERELIQAVVHGKSGLAGIDPGPEVVLSEDAVARIIALVQRYPGEITLVAIGPLTNIALAIQTNPTVMSHLKELIIMGGAIAVAGNKNRVAEFNIFVDPEAAATVIDFPVPKTLVPLDACNDVRLYAGDVMQLHDSPSKRLLTAMLGPYTANIQRSEGVDGALMYDVLTIFYLLRPEACLTKRYNIKVETSSDLTRGMTVADRRIVSDDMPCNAVVVVRLMEDTAVSTFIQELNRGATCNE